jgi:hypothetical protein
MSEFLSYDFTNKHKVYLENIIVKNCVKFEVKENIRESVRKERDPNWCMIDLDVDLQNVDLFKNMG